MTPDIFDLVALAVAVVIAAYLMACEWAKDDNAEANRKNDKGDTSGLNHRQLLAWRLAELFVGLGLCFLVLLWTGSTMWYLLPLAGMAWGVFGSQHVWKLNKLRGKDWRYLAPDGNVWDRVWVYSTMQNGWTDDVKSAAIGAHSRLYKAIDQNLNVEYAGAVYWINGNTYCECVHKAGTRAMKFRAVVFAVSVGGYALILF